MLANKVELDENNNAENLYGLAADAFFAADADCDRFSLYAKRLVKASELLFYRLTALHYQLVVMGGDTMYT